MLPLRASECMLTPSRYSQCTVVSMRYPIRLRQADHQHPTVCRRRAPVGRVLRRGCRASECKAAGKAVRSRPPAVLTVAYLLSAEVLAVRLQRRPLHLCTGFRCDSRVGSWQSPEPQHIRQGQPLPHDRSSNTAHIGLMLTVPQAALRIGAYVVVDLDDTVPLIDEKICSDQTCAFHAKARRIKTAASQCSRRDWPGLRGALGFFLVHVT